MRTTVDIPETLLRQARARAAMEGRKLKDVVNDALARLLSEENRPVTKAPPLPKRVKARQSGRFTFPVIQSRSPGTVVVTPEKLKEAESAADEERHAATFGR